MNVVATARGAIVEVQATAEDEAIPRSELDRMVDLATAGVASLARAQQRALADAGVDLAGLFQPGRWRAA
jgi:ribonuclease PH